MTLYFYMNPEQLRQYLDSHEGLTLEFKKSLHFRDNTARTICAFANSLGGLLIAGVERKNGRTLIHGIKNPDEEDQALAQALG
ncbi:MAG: ATP-binding protein, partial [Candidatus Micrarchaeota archaeon]|nr:ATP-binding protein [Candidatus Micrarchaeota archaeon]